MNSTNPDSNNKHDPRGTNPNLLVAVGASAGGLCEIVKIVESLPTWFHGSVIVATHRAPSHENTLAQILANKARIRVDEPEDEESVECTTIYVGSANDRVEVDGREFDVQDDPSPYARIRRIDDLFKSVAESAGKNAVGVVLSGMLDDGTAGLKAIQAAGGRCVIQSPADAEHADMPVNALSEVDPDFIGTTEEICSYLMEISIDRQCN